MKKKQNYFSRMLTYLGKNEYIIGLMFMIVVATMINPRFLTVENLSNVTRQASMYGLMAVGMSIVIISSSIDLSVGSVYALCAFVALYLSQYSLVLSIVGTLAVGALVGLINSFLIIKMNIDSWVTTLSMMLGLRGVVLLLTNGDTYTPEIKNLSFQKISRGAFFTYLNYPTLIFIGFSVAAYLFLNYTATGRNIYARGGNKEAAQMMGVNTAKTLMFAHVICGVTAAAAGIIVAARIGAAYPLSGDGGEMYAIAACVVGGIYLTGGRGNVLGMFIGSIIIALLTNIFNLQNTLNPFWESVITGSLVLIVVLIQQINAEKETRRKKSLA